jgi:ATP-binding cassette subfamily C (CFTR/MRP) protein 1
VLTTLIQTIINFAKHRAAAKANGTEEPSLGSGIAMAIGIFLLTLTTSVCQHQVSLFNFAFYF